MACEVLAVPVHNPAGETAQILYVLRRSSAVREPPSEAAETSA
jgi:hypothetical protein